MGAKVVLFYQIYTRSNQIKSNSNGMERFSPVLHCDVTELEQKYGLHFRPVGSAVS